MSPRAPPCPQGDGDSHPGPRPGHLPSRDLPHHVPRGTHPSYRAPQRDTAPPGTPSMSPRTLPRTLRHLLPSPQRDTTPPGAPSMSPRGQTHPRTPETPPPPMSPREMSHPRGPPETSVHPQGHLPTGDLAMSPRGQLPPVCPGNPEGPPASRGAPPRPRDPSPVPGLSPHSRWSRREVTGRAGSGVTVPGTGRLCPRPGFYSLRGGRRLLPPPSPTPEHGRTPAAPTPTPSRPAATSPSDTRQRHRPPAWRTEGPGCRDRAQAHGGDTARRVATGHGPGMWHMAVPDGHDTGTWM